MSLPTPSARPRSSATSLAVVVALAALSLSACASDPPDAGSEGSSGAAVATVPVEPPALRPAAMPSQDTLGLAATLQQYREDEASNKISIKVANAGDDPVDVRSLRLDWPGMVEAEPTPLTYIVFPRTKVDLRVPLTPTVCSSPPRLVETLPDVGITAVAEVAIDGGGVAEVTMPVTDPEGVLARIYPRECRRQSIEWSATLSLDETWADAAGTESDAGTPGTMTGELVVTRGGATAPITIEAVHGSVLLNFTIAGPVVLAADATEVRIPVVASNNRCDSHALAEAKKPYLFQVDLVIGDDPVQYVVTPGEGTKSALAAGIIGRCPPEG